MTQITHEDFSEYPEETPQVTDVNVWLHPSGMAMTHDYSCPVCRVRHAIISGGVMKPCSECEDMGYYIIKIAKKRNLLYDVFLGEKDKVY